MTRSNTDGTGAGTTYNVTYTVTVNADNEDEARDKARDVLNVDNSYLYEQSVKPAFRGDIASIGNKVFVILSCHVRPQTETCWILDCHMLDTQRITAIEKATESRLISITGLNDKVYDIRATFEVRP